MNPATTLSPPDPGRTRPLTWRRLVAALFLLAAMIFTGELVRSGPHGALLAACACAVATLGITFALEREAPYPLRAFRQFGVVLAAGAVVSALILPDGLRWAEHAKPVIWMNPLMVVIMGTMSPASASRCVPVASRPGTVLLVTGVVMQAILLGAIALSPRI